MTKDMLQKLSEKLDIPLPDTAESGRGKAKTKTAAKAVKRGRGRTAKRAAAKAEKTSAPKKRPGRPAAGTGKRTARAKAK